MVVGDEAVQAFITALRGANVDYIVAPYEADAQLAFMSLRNLVDVVITEDSDCLVYGCRRILFKMDSTGRGQEICRRDLGENKSPDFEGWTDEQFKLFCCLAGCDYVPRIPSVGIKTAHKIAAGCPSFCDVTRYLGRHKPSHCDTTYFREVHSSISLSTYVICLIIYRSFVAVGYFTTCVAPHITACPRGTYFPPPDRV
jgi:exonuclease-1